MVDESLGAPEAGDASGREDVTLLAYMLYTLTVAGGDHPDRGAMDFMNAHAARHPERYHDAAMTLLAGAYARTGDTNAMERLMENRWRMRDTDEDAPRTGGALGSVVRDEALRLAMLLQVLPNDSRVARLVPELLRLLNHSLSQRAVLNTQEGAWALVALGRFLRLQAEAPPFSGTLYMGEREVIRFSSDAPLSLAGEEALRGREPLRIVMDPGYAPGSCFYTISTMGLPTLDSHQPVSAGMTLTRQLLDRQGDPVDPANPRDAIRQGDLLVMELTLESTAGPIDNVALVNMLPAGLEVENPRLETSERLPWIEKTADAAYQDVRDDRVLYFLDLDGEEPARLYAMLRAVSAGDFAAPPALAEAMYDPTLMATDALGVLTVESDLGAPVPAPEASETPVAESSPQDTQPSRNADDAGPKSRPATTPSAVVPLVSETAPAEQGGAQ